MRTPRRFVIVAALIALVAVTLAARTQAQIADGGGLRLLRTRSSLLGTHHWYQQTHRGVDVIDGVLVRHVHDTGETVTKDHRRPVGRDITVVPGVTAAAAASAAGAFVVRTDLAILPGVDPRLVWAVFSEPPTGTTRTLVDAQTGAVISVERIARDIDGVGRVFNPNPVVTLRDPSLTDQNDADYPALAAAYRNVPLTHLDGGGFLRGDFARIGFDDGDTAYSATNTFSYDRTSTFFSQTMAYFHVTSAQEYLQSLGFTNVNNEPQLLFPDAFLFDNSFYSPASDAIYFGTGGFDDAEDADVIVHEYAHAIQDDQVPGFGLTGLEAASIGEGFADYWAVTVLQPANEGYDVACFADWDAPPMVSPRCLRRIDLDLTIDDRIFEAHYDGQIWSRALWDINQALGRDVANTVVIEAQFFFSPDTSFDDAANATVDTARRLFGPRTARVVQDAFARRGFLVARHAPSPSAHPRQGPPGLREVARLVGDAPGGGQYFHDFEPYGLDERGTALFAADLMEGGEGLFIAGRSGASQIVRSGDPAPSGGVFGDGVVPGPGLNAQGEIAFAFFLDPFRLPVGRNAGVYRWSQGVVRPILVPDETPAPTGGVFVGSEFMTGINNVGTVTFTGMIPTTHGAWPALGLGVFVASADGTIATVAAPGDPAPGGGTFDYAGQPAINDRGDIAFGGHVAGTPCLTRRQLHCVRDLFVKRAGGSIERVVAVGQPAPGGGTFRDILYPVINDRGDILFRAVLATDDGLSAGLFVNRGDTIVAIARPGDPMPGGGTVASISGSVIDYDLNARGDAVFSAGLDTYANPLGELGVADQGLYTWSNGVVSLVVRSGTAVPGGEIIALEPPDSVVFGSSSPYSGAHINDGGQVLFQATVLEHQRLEGILYVRE